MDGQMIDRNEGTTSFVVRQFTSSRIERQLLAQIFDLVFEPPSEIVEQRLAGNDAELQHSTKVHKSATNSHNSGRRAA